LKYVREHYFKYVRRVLSTYLELQVRTYNFEFILKELNT